MRAREFLVHHSLRALVSLIITTDCHYEQERPFPDNKTLEIISKMSNLGHLVSSQKLAASLSRQFETEVNSDVDAAKEERIAAWHNRQVDWLDYGVAITKHERAVQRGDLSNATKALKSFLTSDGRSVHWDTPHYFSSGMGVSMQHRHCSRHLMLCLTLCTTRTM